MAKEPTVTDAELTVVGAYTLLAVQYIAADLPERLGLYYALTTLWGAGHALLEREGKIAPDEIVEEAERAKAPWVPAETDYSGNGKGFTYASVTCHPGDYRAHDSQWRVRPVPGGLAILNPHGSPVGTITGQRELQGLSSDIAKEATRRPVTRSAMPPVSRKRTGHHN